MITRSTIIGGTAVSLLALAISGQSPILDQTPSSLINQVINAVGEWVNPNLYYKRLGERYGLVADSADVTGGNHSGDSHLSNASMAGRVGSAGLPLPIYDESSQWDRNGNLKATRFDPKCPNKECDEPDSYYQWDLKPRREEGSQSPTFVESLEPETSYNEEGESYANSSFVQETYQTWWHHGGTRFVDHYEVEYIYIPCEELPPASVNTPDTFYIGVLGVAALILYRRLRQNEAIA